MKTPAIKIVTYSDKSIAIIGDTKEIKEKFKINGQYIGRFNRFLSIVDEKTEEITKQAGWIFQIKHREFIETIINEYLSKNQSKFEDVFVSNIEETSEVKEQQPLF
jgi:hypothetical protein